MGLREQFEEYRRSLAGGIKGQQEQIKVQIAELQAKNPALGSKHTINGDVSPAQAGPPNALENKA